MFHDSWQISAPCLTKHTIQSHINWFSSPELGRSRSCRNSAWWSDLGPRNILMLNLEFMLSYMQIELYLLVSRPKTRVVIWVGAVYPLGSLQVNSENRKDKGGEKWRLNSTFFCLQVRKGFYGKDLRCLPRLEHETK